MDRAELLGVNRRPEHVVVHELLDGRMSFNFAYQPVVDLKRGVVAGYEVLARFPEELGMRPDEVFQLAARCGLRPELEGRTFAAALKMRESLPPNCFLSINAGPALLLSHVWGRMLRDKISLHSVVVEITEDEPVLDYRELRRRLMVIREMGGFVAVDDTGTGYASLKHVMELRPNFIKLDRFFVGGCHREPSKAAIIEMLGNVASRLDAWIVAEGVETPEELDELQKLGVPLAQGFYLGKPSPTMEQLPALRAEEVRARTRVVASSGLQPIVEWCQSCEDEAEGLTRLAQNADLRVMVQTDGWGRPVRLLERLAGQPARVISQPLKVQLASDAKEVLHRALTRPPEARFDPMVAINEQGMLEGVVYSDRLMRLALDLNVDEERVAPMVLPWLPGERRVRDRRGG